MTLAVSAHPCKNKWLNCTVNKNESTPWTPALRWQRQADLLSWRSAWSIERAPEHSGLHREPCLEKQKQKQKLKRQKMDRFEHANVLRSAVIIYFDKSKVEAGVWLLQFSGSEHTSLWVATAHVWSSVGSWPWGQTLSGGLSSRRHPLSRMHHWLQGALHACRPSHILLFSFYPLAWFSGCDFLKQGLM